MRRGSTLGVVPEGGIAPMQRRGSTLGKVNDNAGGLPDAQTPLEEDQLPEETLMEDEAAIHDATAGSRSLLQAGDIIYLSANHLPRVVDEEIRPSENYLHAHGFCEKSMPCTVVTDTTDFRGCLFRICHALSYEATQTVDAMSRRDSFASKRKGSLSGGTLMRELEERKQREEQTNMKLLESQRGSAYGIKYGQAIQLQHIRSQRFLTMVPRNEADFDKECMKVALLEGSAGSIFKITPEYKIRSEGSGVFSGDHVQLVNSKLAELGFLHHSHDPEQQLHEVNLSVRDGHCGWQMRCYTRYMPGIEGLLTVGQAVRLLHPEAEAFLTASASECKPAGRDRPYLRRLQHDYPEHVDNLNAKSVFIIEHEDPTAGGCVQWEQPYRFRHLISGKYLARGQSVTASAGTARSRSDASSNRKSLRPEDSPPPHTRRRSITSPALSSVPTQSSNLGGGGLKSSLKGSDSALLKRLRAAASCVNVAAEARKKTALQKMEGSCYLHLEQARVRAGEEENGPVNQDSSIEGTDNKSNAYTLEHLNFVLVPAEGQHTHQHIGIHEASFNLGQILPIVTKSTEAVSPRRQAPSVRSPRPISEQVVEENEGAYMYESSPVHSYTNADLNEDIARTLASPRSKAPSKKSISKLWLHDSKIAKTASHSQNRSSSAAVLAHTTINQAGGAYNTNDHQRGFDSGAAATHCLLTRSMFAADSIRIFVVDDFDMWDIEYIMAQIPVIREFIRVIEQRAPHPLEEHEIRDYKAVLIGLHDFIRPSDGALSPARQRICRETKLIDVLFWALAFPFRGSKRVPKPYTQGNLSPRHVILQSLLARAICDTFKDNTRNQIYVARKRYQQASLFVELKEQANSHDGEGHSWLKEMINELGNGFGMGKVMAELVRDNRQVLSEFIDNTVIRTFVELNFVKGPAHTFIDFLRTLASCDGKRISQNQERLLRAMLSVHGCNPDFITHRRDLIIETALDLSSRRPYVSEYDRTKVDELVKQWPANRATGQPEKRVLAVHTSRVIPEMHKYRIQGAVEFETFMKRRIEVEELQQSYSGVSFFEVRSIEAMQVFEEHLRSGSAHIDRGYSFLGKRMYQHGLGNVIVHWHAHQKGKSFPPNDSLLHCPVHAHTDVPEDFEEYLQRVERANKGGLTGDQLKWVQLTDLMWVLEPELLFHHVVMGCRCCNPYNYGLQDEAGNWMCKDGEVNDRSMLAARTKLGHGRTIHVSQEKKEKLFQCSAIPNRTCHGCKTWVDLQNKMRKTREIRSQFSLQRGIARYYESLLSMFAEMALERNYRIIGVLERTFSFELLFCAMENVLLPSSTRACFTRLMVNLYVDRYPHEPINPPKILRPYHILSKDVVLGDTSTKALPQFYLSEQHPLRAHPLPFYHLPDLRKMRMLKFLIQDFLETHKTQQVGGIGNALMLEMLCMLQRLVDSGFYGTAEGIRSFLVRPLFRTLDGRQDEVDDDDYDEDGGDIRTISNRNRGITRSMSMGRSGSMQRSMSGMARKGSLQSAGSVVGAQDVEGLPSVGDVEERWLINSATQPLIECKVNICKIFMRVSDIRVDYRLSKLLHGWRFFADSCLSRKQKEEGYSITNPLLEHVQTIAAATGKAVRRLSRSESFKSTDKENEGNIASISTEFSDSNDMVSVLKREGDKKAKVEGLLDTTTEQGLDQAYNQSVLLRVLEWMRTDTDTAWRNIHCMKDAQVRNVLHERASLPPLFAHGSLPGVEENERHVQLFRDLMKHVFQAHCDTKSTDKKALSLDFEQMTDAPIISILLDLLMYESPNLFECAFMLLFRHFSQRCALKSALEKVQLLVCEEHVVMHAEAKALLSSLRDDIDSITVWGMGNYPSETVEIQLEKRKVAHKRLRSTITTLRRMCYDDGNNSRTANTAAQNLLAGLNTQDVMVRALRVPGRRTDDLYQEWRRVRTVDFNTILRDMKHCCYEFLISFSLENPRTQQALYPFVDAFMAQAGDGTHVIEAIGAIFRNNNTLSSKIPERLFFSFAVSIDLQTRSIAPSIRYIDFFLSVVTISVPATINQNMVLKVMTHPSFTRVARLYSSDPLRRKILTADCEDLTQRHNCTLLELQTAAESQQGKENETNHGERKRRRVSFGFMLNEEEMEHVAEMVYQIKCLNLFSLVCRGKQNVHVRGQSKCRQLFPLEVLLQFLISGTKLPSLDLERARYLNTVFLDCIVPVDSLARMLLLESVIVRFVGIICAFARTLSLSDSKEYSEEKADANNSDFEGDVDRHFIWIQKMPTALLEEHKLWVLEGVLPCVGSFFRLVFDENSHSRAVKITVALRDALVVMLKSEVNQEDNEEDDEDSDDLDEDRLEYLQLNEDEKDKITSILYSAGLLDQTALDRDGKRLSAYNTMQLGTRRSSFRKRTSLERLDSLSEPTDTGNKAMSEDEASTFFLGHLSDFCDDICKSRIIKLEIEEEFDMMASTIRNVKAYTDPNDDDYTHLDDNAKALDPRRACISYESLSSRMIRHACLHFHNAIDKGSQGWVFAILKCFRRQMEMLVPDQELSSLFQKSNVLLDNHDGWLESLGDSLGVEGERADERMEREERERQVQDLQTKLSSWGLSRLLIMMVSHAANDDVKNDTAGGNSGWQSEVHLEVLMLFCRLIWDGNADVQNDCLKVLKTEDGSFFAACHAKVQEDLLDIKARRQQSEKAHPVNRSTRSFSRKHSSSDSTPTSNSTEEAEQERLGQEWERKIQISCLMWRVLQLFCENHNHDMQELVRTQPHARQQHSLVEDAVTTLCALLPDFTTIEKQLQHAELQLASFILDFLIESVQGPCAKNQEFIAHSPAVAAIVRLLPTTVKNVWGPDGGFSEICALRLESEPQPENRLRELARVPFTDTRFHAYTPKEVKSKAVTLLCGLLEGRQDYKLHAVLMHAIDPSTVVRPCLTSTFLIGSIVEDIRLHSVFHSHELVRSLRYQAMNVEKEDEWEAEYRQEAYGLLSLTNALSAAPGPAAAAYRKSIQPQSALCGMSKQSFKKLTQCRSKYAAICAEAKMDEPDAVKIFTIGLSFLSLAGAPTHSEPFSRFHVIQSELENLLPSAKQKEAKQLHLACLEVLVEACYTQAFLFFQDGIKSVEVYWKDHLHRVYFPRPPQCAYLEEEAKSRVLASLDISTFEDKGKDFLNKCKHLHAEMLHYEHLSSFTIPGIGVSPYAVLGKNLKDVIRVNFGVAVLINVLMLTTLTTGTGSTSTPHEIPIYSTPQAGILIALLGTIQAALSCLVLGFRLVKRGPLKVKAIYQRMSLQGHHQHAAMPPEAKDGHGFHQQLEAWKDYMEGLFGQVIFPVVKIESAILVLAGMFYARQQQPWIMWLSVAAVIPLTIGRLRIYWNQPSGPISFLYVCAYDIFLNHETMFRVLHTTFSVLGLVFRRYFYAFHLFELIIMSPTLTNVVRAVWVPAVQLGMTAVLALVVLYSFTLIGFYFFRDSFFADNAFDENYCSDLYSCFIFTVHVGLLSGGGVGEYLTFENEQMPGTPGLPSTLRLGFDIVFFAVVTIGLLNIVFGIMIDTFSKLREDQQNRNQVIKNTCLICNHTRADFTSGQRLGAFQEHISKEHNLFNYLYFVTHCNLKPDTEHNGLESYVYQCVQREDIIWLPNEAALSLRESDTKDVDLHHIDRKLSDISERLDHQLFLDGLSVEQGTDDSGNTADGSATANSKTGRIDRPGSSDAGKGMSTEIRTAIETVQMEVSDLSQRLGSLEATVLERLDLLATAITRENRTQAQSTLTPPRPSLSAQPPQSPPQG